MEASLMQEKAFLKDGKPFAMKISFVPWFLIPAIIS